MDTFIAVVFDNDQAAFKGADALRDLHQDGDVLVYSAAVIGKDADGNVSIKKAVAEGPIGTAFGALVGSMVGVLAGPAGMVVGGLTGGTFGMFRDLFEAGIDADTLEKVSMELSPGKSAVVAGIDEAWTTPLDVKMESLGGTVFRKARIDVIDEQIERDIEASDAEMRALEEEWNEADEAARAAIRAKIDGAKKYLSEATERATQRLEKLDSEFDARQKALDEQIANAVGQAKAKFEKRKGELQEELETRSEKLNQATKLAGEALT
jgi:uncharacterized membrane protein